MDQDDKDPMNETFKKLKAGEITHGEALKALADYRRAQDRADAEAKRLGLPTKPMTMHTVQDGQAAKDIKNQPILSAIADDEILLNSAEGAKLLGYSEKSFRNAVAAGKIPHYKLMGQNRFKKSELLTLLVRVEPK